MSRNTRCKHDYQVPEKLELQSGTLTKDWFRQFGKQLGHCASVTDYEEPKVESNNQSYLVRRPNTPKETTRPLACAPESRAMKNYEKFVDPKRLVGAFQIKREDGKKLSNYAPISKLGRETGLDNNKT